MASQFTISPRKIASKVLFSPTEGYVRYVKTARLTAEIKQFEEARLGLRNRFQSVIILSSRARQEAGIIRDPQEFERIKSMPRERDVQYATLLTSRARREAGIILSPQHLIDPFNGLPVFSVTKSASELKTVQQERKEWRNVAEYYLRAPINLVRMLIHFLRNKPLEQLKQAFLQDVRDIAATWRSVVDYFRGK